ncbi:FGGY family carbohydrate kinase [Microbacterium betulae]|uniref:FGGY family carbohydrate kinase n=1 Tax=Microbacterium betulae TaxID=2981139 RepID=A0AA97FIN5_9MICO|nr:FGGY family carbohydrate kinase [Microbacterium sp. AB]WOF22985.1 FGGY family carbohydrate kinase [Microbacterium sp. AB]
MTAAEVALGVDLGSHGVRVAAARGREVLAEASRLYPGALPPARRPLETYWRTLVLVVRDLPDEVRAAVGAMAVAAIRGSVVALGADGEPLSEVLPDFDVVSLETMPEVRAAVGAAPVARTGCPVFPLSGLPKLSHLMRRTVAVPGSRLVGPQDAVNRLLTGRLAMGVGVARRLGILRAETAEPDGELLGALGLSHVLPELVAIDEVVGGLLPEAADALGLRHGIPVVSAPGDTPVALRGLADSPDFASRVLLASLSTTTVTSVVSAPGVAARLAGDLTYEVLRGDLSAPGSRAVEGGDGTGMFQVDWLCGLLRCRAEELDALAGARVSDASLAIDTPFMDVWGTGRAGSIEGLVRETGPAELAFAVLAAVADGAIRMIERLSAHSAPDIVVLAGGGARSRTVRSRIEAAAGIPVLSLADRQLAALGAAVVAARATGIPAEVAA